jgi:hypothetical protein
MTGWQDDPDIKAAIARAAELSGLFNGMAVVREAELAMDGIYPACVSHGDPEDHDSANLIYEALPDLARKIGQLTGAAICATHGGHGWTTFLYSGPGADNAASALVLAVHAARLQGGALQHVTDDPALTAAESRYLTELAAVLDGQHFPHWWHASGTSTPAHH